MSQEIHYLETGSQDPFYNLAFEETVLRSRRSGEYLLLWQNDNTIVIGQNQNAEGEINRAFVEAHQIHVVRRTTGGGAAQHSQCVESWFAHIPGIKVVAPSNPYDAKMVLKAAIECDDPVLYFENKILYKEKGEVPEIGEEEPYTLGKARVEREGKDVTIVSYSIGMKNARGAADLLAKEGIEAEVIDLITLSPWDKETVLNSVKKTHRLCIVHEAVKQGGFGAEISATVAEEAMEYLDAPILRYGAPFCPIPFAPTLEKMVKVVPEDLVKGIKGMF